MTRFHGILFALLTACTYEITEEPDNAGNNGEDMSFAKSATGRLVTKGTGVVQVQDDFDGVAQNYTVQFWLGQRIASGGGAVGVFTPVGEILWSIGGNTQRRLVSVFDGTAITGVAEHFTVKATDQTDPADTSNITEYDITITAARGVRGSTALPPTYQTYITNAGVTKLGAFSLGPIGSGTNILDVPIPSDVGVNSVMVTAASIGVVLTGAEFDFAQEYSVPALVLKRYNPLFYNFVTISSQADILHFSNLTPAIGGITIEFSIAWGIDG